MEEVQIVQNSCQNPEVPQNLQQMYNNKKYSDTVFLVNQAQFHASSHLVSVSCKVLESTLDEHFENCGDREVKIGLVNHDMSFSVILKYIYGLEIKFSEYNTEVLCEVLQLSQRYDLKHFLDDLKAYLSSLHCFQIETIVPLLNMAKEFELPDLYEKLKGFVNQNAESLVKHRTFIDLKYNIVSDLIKSDWFYMDEIEILNGVLNWHDSNIINSSTIDQYMYCENNDEYTNEGNKEDNNVNTLGEQEKEASEVDSNDESVLLQGKPGNSGNNSNGESANSQAGKDILQTFSDKVLMSLLSHVRLNIILAVEMFNLSKTELFVKYKNFLVEFKYCSPISELRKKFIPPVLFNDTNVRKFSINWILCNKMYDSNEEEVIGDIKWKLSMTPTHYKTCLKFNMYLKCASDVLKNWECTASCQLKLLSKDEEIAPSLIIPGDNMFLSVTLSSKKPCVEFCQFNFHLKWMSGTDFEDGSRFEMILKSMYYRILE